MKDETRMNFFRQSNIKKDADIDMANASQAPFDSDMMTARLITARPASQVKAGNSRRFSRLSANRNMAGAHIRAT